MNLRVRVNDDLVLDAGTVHEHDARELMIVPFRQVLDYLGSKPDPSPRPQLTADGEGIVAAAVSLRWGSYFAVLADTGKPVWNEARSPEASRISNAEMARINIEASAVLAEWIDVARQDRTTYEKLAGRALAYLPFPKLRLTPAGSDFAMLAMKDVAQKMIAATDADHFARVRADAQGYATRIFANALVNVAWRNGPAEDIHAGHFRGYPLDRRRITTGEERTLLDFAAGRLVTGMEICRGLTDEREGRSWPEQVVPYGLAKSVTPTGWTLTETTREVRLPRR